MVKLVAQSLLLGLYLQVLAVFAVDAHRLNIWPMPQSVSNGHQILHMSKDFELMTQGTKYPDASGILKDGFSRLLDVVQAAHVVDGNFSHFDQSVLLQGIHVVIFSLNDELQYGIDESYKLSIPAAGNPVYAHLEAQTVYGALHGLQTFSQLCHFNFTTGVIEVHQVPWNIIDQPRFSYRGLLIDTSRHYQPLPMIKKVIDSMAYTKLILYFKESCPASFDILPVERGTHDCYVLYKALKLKGTCRDPNVLHWHIVDSQSFPLEIPSYPKLWFGAYSISERYAMADAAEIVSYAQRRGINVLAEIDVPGHALSWGTGYPSLWPSKDCQQPLDVSNEFTFKVIDGILSDFSKIFKFKFVHLGGDEVDTSCWAITPHVKKWEETFNNFGDKLSRKTVVHNWLGGGVAERVVAAGLRCIVSNQDKWYLDHLDTTWPEFYMNEPLTNITNPKQQELVIGGEVCMWGEQIDGSDIEQTIWPRAAAAAERLWSPYDNLAKDPRQITGRLAHFRCLLNQRGVAAAPLAGPGRVAPQDPGSCYMQ
ncbi:unnamed protein product [Camellia sinensis]